MFETERLVLKEFSIADAQGFYELNLDPEVLRYTGDYIGFCGLNYRSAVDEVDLGFRLRRSRWGKGYATEAARESLSYGFKTYNLERIVARAMKDALASLGRCKSILHRTGYYKSWGCVSKKPTKQRPWSGSNMRLLRRSFYGTVFR